MKVITAVMKGIVKVSKVRFLDSSFRLDNRLRRGSLYSFQTIIERTISKFIVQVKSVAPSN